MPTIVTVCYARDGLEYEQLRVRYHLQWLFQEETVSSRGALIATQRSISSKRLLRLRS